MIADDSFDDLDGVQERVRNVRYGDLALLVPTNAASARWLRMVGTYHRAKSLDFAHVCIPARNLFPRPQRLSEPADAFRERTQLERRQLYVAITRWREAA